MFRRLLVPLDGSPESEDILPEASRIAAETAEFFLLHVTPVLQPPDISVTEVLRLPQASFDYLEGVRSRLRHSRVRVLVRQGDPAEEITQAALELGADLVAMSTHGRGGLRRVLLGSVAEEVVRRGPPGRGGDSSCATSWCRSTAPPARSRSSTTSARWPSSAALKCGCST